MTEYDLDKFCQNNPDCGCNCMRCPAFVRFHNEELYGNNYDEEDEEY